MLLVVVTCAHESGGTFIIHRLIESWSNLQTGSIGTLDLRQAPRLHKGLLSRVSTVCKSRNPIIIIIAVVFVIIMGDFSTI